MKQVLTLFLVTTAITLTAGASSLIYRVSDYRCTNGQNYHVVSEHRGGYGVTTWSISAFCSDHIMSRASYIGYGLSTQDSQEISDCQNQISTSLAICFDEYRSLNDQEGRGVMPAIIHGQRQ